jgi:hypothetical protein
MRRARASERHSRQEPEVWAARIGRVELRGAFVVAQIALSAILLIGGGLLARSLMKLQDVDLGFDPSNLLTLEFRLPATKYSEPQQISEFFTRAIAEIRRFRA